MHQGQLKHCQPSSKQKSLSDSGSNYTSVQNLWSSDVVPHKPNCFKLCIDTTAWTQMYNKLVSVLGGVGVS